MNRQDQFLAGVVVFIVLGLAALTMTGLIQYENDSKQFQDMHKEQEK